MGHHPRGWMRKVCGWMWVGSCDTLQLEEHNTKLKHQTTWVTALPLPQQKPLHFSSISKAYTEELKEVRVWSLYTAPAKTLESYLWPSQIDQQIHTSLPPNVHHPTHSAQGRPLPSLPSPSRTATSRLKHSDRLRSTSETMTAPSTTFLIPQRKKILFYYLYQ